MAPRDFFDENPYKNDKPLPPARRLSEKRLDLKPFKPSSPAKTVGLSYSCTVSNGHG